jgi:hypothetical protein
MASNIQKLHPKQAVAFQSKATEILYGGAAGGGKSHLMRIKGIEFCWNVPGVQVYLFRRLSDDLLKNHMEGPTGFPAILSPWIDRKLVKITYSPASITFWNDAKIHLCHCQYEKDVIKYQGPEIHVLLIDELTHFTEFMYRFLRGRTRTPDKLKVPDGLSLPYILTGSNPGGVGHNWVKRTFIDGAMPFEIRKVSEDEGGMLRQFIPATLQDNPSLNRAEYANALRGLGNPELVKAMLKGSWEIVAGGALNDLWTPEKHIIRSFEIPSSWRIDRSFDWGSSKPFSVGWWAESDGTEATMRDGAKRCWPPGTLFRIAEWYGWNGKENQGSRLVDSEIARGILRMEKEMGIAGRVRPGPADSSIFDDTNVDCPANIQARQGVKWERADKSPGSRSRGLEVLRRYLRAGLEYPMEDPGLFVFETCHQFIRTVPTLPLAKGALDDVDSDAEDHIYDETRYRLLTPKRVFSSQQQTGGW